MNEAIQQLGKYHILEQLGKGGFATVYRALDPTLDREVALKVLDPLLTRDETWVERFHREARAVARLKHPRIVTIYEIGEAEGRLFIAMELVRGPSLAQAIAQRGALTWDDTLLILKQVADALDYAHVESIVHRDLKPGNILLNPRTGAVLTDFGFAKLLGESSMSVSLSGGVVGTPAYIAPEVWDGEDATPQADIYALASVVYEVLTGEVLFGGKTPSVVMRKHLIDGPQLPAQWPDGVPDGVTNVLRRALARNPTDRYSSAGAFMADLQALTAKVPDPLAGQQEQALAAEDVVQLDTARAATTLTDSKAPPAAGSPFDAARQMPRQKRMTLLGIGGLVIAAVCAVLGLGWWMSSRQQATLTPTPTVVLTATPELLPTTPSVQPTLTSRPTNTTTPTPTLTPTWTPSPTLTPQVPTSTPMPSFAVKPSLQSPGQGQTYQNPVTFQWAGALASGQTYLVRVWHADSGYSLQSVSLSTTSWTVDLPGEYYGDWRWVVTVLQGGISLSTSEEGMFWFDPIPGAGGGEGGEPTEPSSREG